MLLSLLFGIGFAQTELLQYNDYVETVSVQMADANGEMYTEQVTRLKASLTTHFSEKFTCRSDALGVYTDWLNKMYPGEQTEPLVFMCCGYMANGREQCDKLQKWRKVGDSHFVLCDTNYADAISEGTTNNPSPRRDLCCENDEFQDCALCKSFTVWDFTVDHVNSHGGDPTLERDLLKPDCSDAAAWQLSESDGNDECGKTTLSVDWRTMKSNQPLPAFDNGATSYPSYAYDNKVYPAGYQHATLREFNDPPVCVYVPNVAGRIIEIKVEPDGAESSQVCVDDLHADSLEKNEPGVTQACDGGSLTTCFPDANSECKYLERDLPQDQRTPGVNEGSAEWDQCRDREETGRKYPPGFAFLISCEESCADTDIDLWYRVRASLNKWTDAGNAELGTDQTEVNTEMWCMWGNQNMQDENNQPNFPVGPDGQPLPIFDGLDGDFSKWNKFPSDLEPEEDAVVRPIQGGAGALSIVGLLSIFALLF